MEEIGLFEAIYSQRQITSYKPDPVPREAIDRILEAATKAPSGGNSQPWDFIVITDPELIAKVSQIYREQWLSNRGTTPVPGEPPAYRAARHLAQHMHEVPVLILVSADHSRGSAPYNPGDPIVRNKYSSSVWLAVQNLFLAARALGLGTRLTSTHNNKRNGNQGVARHPRPYGDDGPNTDGLPEGPVRPYRSPSVNGGDLL